MSISNKKTTKRYIVKRDLKGLFPKEFTSRELIGKYFDYVMNNFFQSSYERYINGYIGRKTNTLEEGNYYVTESTPERQLYQLTPMLVDTNENNDIKDIVDYTNFINDLKLQGSLTNDHNRLLSNMHWSYCPPIDVDMFLNYNFYYWVEEGIKPIILENKTNVITDIIGKPNYTYEYTDETLETKIIPFYNGMRIIFRNDDNIEYNNKPFIVEGVNSKIILIDDSEIYNPNNNEDPEYFVMERGCKDGNPWSLRNRWFHIDDIKLANHYNQSDDDNLVYIQAKKPILCFNRDIELYNFGDYNRGWVDVITTEIKNNINGKLIEKSDNDGKLYLEGKYLDNGAKILFTNEPNIENNMIYELFLIDNGNYNLVTLYPVVNGKDTEGKPVKGECIKIKNKLNYCYHYDGENWIVSQQKLKVCQSPLFNLYDKNGVLLNDKTIYPNSTFYGNTLFNYKPVTNKSASIDEDLKRRYASDGYGNYIFINSIESEEYSYRELGSKNKKSINGIKFYKKEDKFLNDWHLSKDVLTQYVITEITVPEVLNDYTLIDENLSKKYYNCFNLSYQPCENLYKNNSFVYVNGQLLNNEMYFISDKVLYISKDIDLKPYDNIFVKLLISNNDEVINIVVTEINDSKSFILNYNYSGELTKQNVFVYINDLLVNNDKYYIKNNVLYFDKSIELNINDVITVKILTDDDEKLADGYVYDLPLMLTSNALNENVTEIKYNEMFPQLESILENQIGFEGVINGANNYKDTLKDVSLGTKILQHSTPILKTMLLNSKQYTNVRNVLTYISSEYTKFKNKFNLIINNMVESGQYKEFDLEAYTKTNPFDIVIKALNKINIGKEGLKPFYNNGVAEQLINLDDEDNNYLVQPYIPSTPAYLGLDNCYEPKFIKANNLDLKQDVLLCHDGSYMPISNDYRDEALLELETQIYNSINEDFKNGLPTIIKQKYIPGKFRNTDYSYEDYLKIYTPFFEKWVIENNLDYTTNDTFNEYNSFTWNWSSCYDKDGFKLPGSYRGIYMYYYDTDKPHTNPWEMLGFSNKPSWWEEHYGNAPYTSENIPMWKDIEEGHIVDGISEGYYEEFKRPGLIENYLPVDSQGNLLPPYEAGIATSKPIMKYARESWKIGDLGHVENMFKYTSEYRYDLQAILYLMKPLMWVETSWDSLSTDILFSGTDYEQMIDLNIGKRDKQDNITMHNELINGEYIKKIGSQQWFSDFLTDETINITDYIANDLRNIDVRLGYRCAGFFDKNSMRLLSDNYGVIPSNNYHLKLNEKITGDVFNYSGIIITKKENYWVVDGYDNEYPYFNILTPYKNGKKSSVEINGRNFTYYHEYNTEYTPIKYKTIFTSAQELYNMIIGYGKYLESIGFVFNMIDSNGETINFRYCGKQFLLWYSTDVETNTILILNPLREELNLKHFGFANTVGKFFNGYWSIKDQMSNPIYNKDLRVYRHNGYITISPKYNYLSNVKITTSEKENVMIIDNETIYGDTLFNSLKGIKTDRFKLLGIKTNGWNGTYFTPGYIINQDETIEPNYDKLANDFNFIYDSDDVRSISKMGDEAKKTIGYHKTNYMENLVIDDRNMFDFYKGMLKEKGTKLAFNKLNRSTRIMSEGSSKLNLDEHWAFNIGQFGYTNNKSTTELYIKADNINHDPQIITYSTDPNYYSTDNSNISINWGSKDWLKNNENQDKNTFEYKNSNKKLPIGGFAHLDDVKYILDTKEKLLENTDNINIGEKTWVVKDTPYTWNIYKKINDIDNPFKSLKVKNINGLLSYDCHNLDKNDLIYVEHDVLNNWITRLTDDETGNETNIYFNDPYGLTHNDNYNIKTNGWSVFKYNGLVPYSNIISMDNGIVSILNNDTYYSVRIEKDLMIDMPDGLDDEGNNKYIEYRLSRYLNVKLEDNDKYLFIDDIGNYYTSSEKISFEEPENPIKNQFWYDKDNNIFNRYNGYYWDNSSINLYAWSDDSNTYYTTSINPTEFENVYEVDDNINITKYGNIIQQPRIKKFAWIKNSEIYYTDNEYPIAGDKVYANPTTDVYTYIVSSYFEGNDFFYVEDIKFERSEENDINANITITNNITLYRDSENDKSSKHYAYIAEVKVDSGSLIDINISNPFSLERVEPKPINSDLIKSTFLVNNENDRTLGKMYLYDPLHCVLPEFIMNEIDYILSYDPVNYNDGNRWYDDKLGRLWWDTSKVRYLDYYQGDLKYRRDNWGKQLPGSEICIMEWTKSTILPDDIGENYLTREVYNPETDKNDIFYYFWVLNPTITPEYDFRTTSAYDISRKINSPQDEGILWISPIQLNDRIYNDSSFIIGNFDDVTTSQDFVIQINFKNKNDIDDHNEWLMIVPNSEDNIPDLLWNKMKDSLITEDSMGNIVPDSSLSDIEKYGISLRPRQTMFKNIVKARRNFVDICNDVFTSRDVRYFSNVEGKGLLLKDESYNDYDISYTFETHEEMINTPDKSLIGKYVLVNQDEEYDNIWTLWLMEGINDYKLIDYQKYDMKRYIYYIDAFLNNEYTKDTYNLKIYNNIDVNAKINSLIENGIPDGYIVRIDDYVSREWLYLRQYNSKDRTFYTVGMKNGYIQLNDSLYSYMEDSSLINNYNDKINGLEYDEFINGLTEYEYIDNEVKKLIEIICNYFYNN